MESRGVAPGYSWVAPAGQQENKKTKCRSLVAETRSISRFAPPFGHLNIVRRLLGDLRAVTLTTARVNDYSNRRLEEKRKPATINRETAMLRAALRLAFRRRQISSVLEIPRLREDNARQGFFRANGIQGCEFAPTRIPPGLCSIRLFERLAQIGDLFSAAGGRR